MAFVFFLIAVALYIAFLLWCLSPLVRRARRRWLGRLRVALAFLLLAANGVPLLAIPIVGPVALFSNAAAGYLFNVILFPWTVPYYIENIRTRASATANVIEMVYPIEIAGVRYAPVLRSVCGTRKVLWTDKLPVALNTKNGWIATGLQFEGQAGDAIIAIRQPLGDLCSVPRDGRISDYFWPQVHVFRGTADQTKSYRISLNKPVVVDDIVLQRPEVVRIGTAPAREIPLDAFWPTERSGDDGYRPLSTSPYWQPAVLKSDCVERVTVSLGKVERSKRTGLVDRVLPAQWSAHCHRVLDGLWPKSLPRIAPVG